jgi:hypothetical protein
MFVRSPNGSIFKAISQNEYPSCAPSPLVGEGAPLNWRPSADAVAGNGWDGGRGEERLSVPSGPFSFRCLGSVPPFGKGG